MPIVTENPHAWFISINSKGIKQNIISNEEYEHNYPFGFEVNFSDTPSPQKNTVTLYNLSKKHRDFYEKGQKCYVAFNWGTSKKIIAEGYITRIGTNQSDGTTETMVVTFTEGTDYNNVKARKLKLSKNKRVNKYKNVKVSQSGHYVKKRARVNGHWKYIEKYVKPKIKNKRIKTRANKTILVNKTYRKGTDYKKLIQGVAGQADIKIAKLELAKNPTLKSSYTAKGKPLTLLKQLVKKTGSKMVYIRGKLEIINPKAKKRTWYNIDDQDLISPPAYNEDSEGTGSWQVTIPLVPEITTNSGVKMDSRYLKGDFYVRSGQHTFDGSSLQTQMLLVKI